MRNRSHPFLNHILGGSVKMRPAARPHLRARARVDKLADVVSIVISLFFRMMCKIKPHGR
jgi:hypothetical protein